MPTTGYNTYCTIGFLVVNNTIFVIYPSRPIPLQIPFEWFWLAYADSHPIALNILYKVIYTAQGLFILRLPIKIVIPSSFSPCLSHG